MNIVRSIFYPAQPSVVLFSEEKNRSHNNNSHIAHFLNGLNINNNRRTSLRYACIFTSSAFGCTHVRKQSTNDTVKRNVNVFSTTKWNEYKQTANYKPLYNRFFFTLSKGARCSKIPISLNAYNNLNRERKEKEIPFISSVVCEIGRDSMRYRTVFVVVV